MICPCRKGKAENRETISTQQTRLQEVMLFWSGFLDETVHTVAGLLQGPRGGSGVNIKASVSSRAHQGILRSGVMELSALDFGIR